MQMSLKGRNYMNRILDIIYLWKWMRASLEVLRDSLTQWKMVENQILEETISNKSIIDKKAIADKRERDI